MHTCGQLTQLAACRGDRAVLRCTCGALHLIWENATVQLYPDDLLALLQTLRLGKFYGSPFRVLNESPEATQVWLYNVGLRLTRHDLGTLISLLREADAARVRLELPALASGARSTLRVN